MLAEPDLRRRADCALVQVFAERVGRGPLWQKVVEGLTMTESPIIAQLLNDNTAKNLLHVLRKRYGTLPEDLAASVRASANKGQLDRWFDLALDAASLDQFRQQAGL